MATRMLQRRGTAADWAAANPILASGEIGFETDTKILKLGDGVTPWNELNMTWVSTGGGVMSGPLSLIAPTENNHAARVMDIDDRAPSYAVYTRTSPTTLASGAHTLITWQQITRQNGSWTSPNTSTITIAKKGMYRFTLALFLGSTVNGWVQGTLTRNEGTVTAGAPFVIGGDNSSSAGATGLVQGTSHPISCQVGDVFRAFVFNGHSSSRDLALRGDAPFLAFERICDN